MSRITDRDREIMQHIDKYKFITLKQTVELFMPPNASSAHMIAEKRLKAIQNSNHLFGKIGKPGVKLKNGHHPYTKESIYYYNKMPTYHDLQAFNVYARLVFLGIEIDFFKAPAPWHYNKYISDAFFTYTVPEERYKKTAFLEICHSNNDPHLKGYEDLYLTNELQDKLVGAFPDIILVGHKGKLPETLLNVKKVKADLSDIHNIFVNPKQEIPLNVLGRNLHKQDIHQKPYRATNIINKNMCLDKIIFD